MAKNDILGKPLKLVSENLEEIVKKKIVDPQDAAKSEGINFPGSPLEFHVELSPINDMSGKVRSWIVLLDANRDTQSVEENYARSYALVSILSRVAAKVASLSNPEEVLSVLGEELSKQNMKSVYILTDKDFTCSKIEFASPITKKLKPLEKFTGLSLLGYSLPRNQWPPVSFNAIKDGELSTFSRFYPDILPAFIDLVSSWSQRLKFIGITKQTSGLFIPISFKDSSRGLLVVWGTAVQEQDLVAFSIFGSQIGSAMEQARFHKVKSLKTQELERSQALTLL